MEKEKKEKKVVVGFWLRLVSDTIDTIILGLFGLALALPLMDVFNKIGENGLWIGLVITFLYTGILQSSFGKGQSLAKKILKIQVLRRDGSYLSLTRSFLRYLIIALIFYNGWIAMGLFNIFPSLNNYIFPQIYSYVIFTLMIGCAVMVSFHPLKRGLHDLIADSIVVRKRVYTPEKVDQLENPKKQRSL